VDKHNTKVPIWEGGGGERKKPTLGENSLYINFNMSGLGEDGGGGEKKGIQWLLYGR